MLLELWLDEGGAIVSAELVLVMTILVLGLVVGMNEVATSVNSELNDVSNAIGSVNQSFYFSGFHARKGSGWGGWGGYGGGGGGFCGLGGFGTKAWTPGSAFIDTTDDCDNDYDITCSGASGETAVSCQLSGGGVRQGAIQSGPAVLIGPATPVGAPVTTDPAANGPIMQVP